MIGEHCRSIGLIRQSAINLTVIATVESHLIRYIVLFCFVVGPGLDHLGLTDA